MWLRIASDVGDSFRDTKEIARNGTEEGPMTDEIERETLIPAPPEQVWHAITAPGFLADEVELELEPGGDARFGDGRTGWVEEAVEAERLTFWWSADGEPASRVEITLDPEEDGHTRLRVTEARPLEVLDVTGIPLPGGGGAQRGPAMLAAV
jgi:uncharacterized protein YndB with AHSA1/START domain